ncbi:heptaprenyl diphosphate synthase [Pseudobutyrivibrio sp. ACV-2]|uniref:Gx transporter family protein n=1 Tax=Pseudobutyrivibrio sp. ACV-2 TaxID=1520801 RepID=UPI0008973783|nr:Gx transporter family protein [Pseudobutyrivibrio sp. ACV-2]SEA64366.1 heptaprenyl diphosphate synthase [Pseudobutyrivibrio sp. ACV-2]
MKSRKIAFLGLLIALAFVLSYVEMLLPINIGIPGAKVGLANLVIMVALYAIGEKNAFILSVVRVVLVGLTFGNLAMMIYSLAGAMLSFAAMFIAKRIKLFSVTGVSVIGGVFHNLGQIIVAIIVLDTASLIYYFPFLVVVGTVSGIVIGIISGMIIERFKKNNFGF